MANKKQVAAIKRRLEAYGTLVRKKAIQEERLAKLVAASFSTGSALTGMPSGGGQTDSIGANLERQEKLRREIDLMEKAIGDELMHIGLWIRQLPRMEEGLLLEMRYIDLAEWEYIIGALYKRERDFADRYEKYQRRAYRLHVSALAHLADLAPPQ